MDEEEIAEYLAQTQDAASNSYGSKLQLKQRKADKAADYARFKDSISKVNAFNGAAQGIGNKFSNDSVYDKGITAYDVDRGINTYRDSQQSDLLATGNALLHGATAFGAAYGMSALLTNPWGLGAIALASAGQAIYNAVDDVDDNATSWFTNNLIFRAIGGTQELINENTPVYTEDADKEGLVARNMGLSGLDQISQGLGFLVGGMKGGKAAASKLGPGTKFYDTINKSMGGKGLGLSAEAMSTAGRTVAEEAAQIAKAKKFTDGVSGFTGSAIGRLGESIFERQGTQKEMLQKGYSQEEADNAADLNFMANMAMSSIDYAQNIKMLGVFDKINPKWSSLDAGKFGKKASKYFLEGAKNVSKYDKPMDIIGAIGKNFVLEGAEEGIQYATNRAAQENAQQKGNMFDFLVSTGSEFGKSFTTEEGQMSWILGGLMGGGASGIYAGTSYNTPKELAQIWKNANDLKTDIDKNYKINENAFYTEYKKPDGTLEKVINQDFIDTVDNNGQLEAIKEYAVGKNDKALYETAKNKQVLNQTLFNISIGNYDNFETQLKKTDAGVEEIKAMKALQQNKKLSEVGEVTPEDVENYKKESAKALQLAQDFKKSYETAQSLPGFVNLSKPAMMKFADVLASQKAIDAELKSLRPDLIPALEEYSAANQEIYFPKNTKKKADGTLDLRVKENKEAVANQALTVALNNLTDPIEQAKLTDDYNKYRELNVANKELISKYKEYLADPKKLESSVTQQKLTNFKADIEQRIAGNKLLKELNNKLKATKEPKVIRVTNEDGTISEYTIANKEGVLELIDIADGSTQDISILGENYTIEKTDKKINFDAEEEEDDEYESQNYMNQAAPKKESLWSSTGNVWRMVKNALGVSVKDIDDDGEWVVNLENEEYSKFMSNPENTPGMVVNGKTKNYSWLINASVNVSDAKLKAILEDVNKKRAGDRESARTLRPLTIQDLKSNPAYQLVTMTLHENGVPIKGKNGKYIQCYMHDLGHFRKTAEFERITKNEKLTPTQKVEAIVAAEERITLERKNIIDAVLKLGTPLYAPVVAKSQGTLSFISKKNGKRQNKSIIGRLVNNLSSLIEHKAVLPDSKGRKGLIPGLGVVTQVINNQDGTYSTTVKYLKRSAKGQVTETFEGTRKYVPSQLIFNDIASNGENVKIAPFIRNVIKDEELDGIADALFYFVTQQKNQFTVGDKEYNIFSKFLLQDGTKGGGIIDAIIGVYAPGGKKFANSINASFIDDKYILSLGGKKANPETITKEAIKKFLQDSNPEGIKYQVKDYPANTFKDGFVFPTSIDPKTGEAKVEEHASYLDFLFSGDDPRIGTDVSKDYKYANSYMTLAMSGSDVLLTNNPSYVADYKAPTSEFLVPSGLPPSAFFKEKSEKKSSSKGKLTEDAIVERILKKDTSLSNELNDDEIAYISNKLLTESIKVYSNALEETFGTKLTDALQYLSKYSNGANIFRKFSILEGLAATDTKEYNRFASNIRFQNIPKIKTEEEVQEENCNGVEANKTDSTTVEKPNKEVDPSIFDVFGDSPNTSSKNSSEDISKDNDEESPF